MVNSIIGHKENSVVVIEDRAGFIATIEGTNHARTANSKEMPVPNNKTIPSGVCRIGPLKKAPKVSPYQPRPLASLSAGLLSRLPEDRRPCQKNISIA